MVLTGTSIWGVFVVLGPQQRGRLAAGCVELLLPRLGVCDHDQVSVAMNNPVQHNDREQPLTTY